MEYTDEWLKDNGYNGLFVKGECGCECGDLRPCSEKSDDCNPGYKHFDPREGYKGYWAIWDSKEEPDDDEWEQIFY